METSANTASNAVDAEVVPTHGKNEKARLAVQASVAAKAAAKAAKTAELLANPPAKVSKKKAPVLAAVPAAKTQADIEAELKVNIAALKTLPVDPKTVAFVMSEPLTNFIALTMNGDVIPFRSNEVSVSDRTNLKGVVYGHEYTTNDFFMCTSENNQAAVAKALAGIRGRWNSSSRNAKYKSPVGAWVTVPAKHLRTK